MNYYSLLADLVLIVHTGVIVFVVGGLLAIVIGALAGWKWVINRVFRLIHLLAITYIVGQTWLGASCPLTRWENSLRLGAHESTYEAQGFIAYWLHRLIFYQAPSWVFTLSYTLFALIVAATLFWVPPRWRNSEIQAQKQTPQE
ncbi:MAG: DUF2784 domain-containing protein [Phycisphaerales bacterium]|nr:DUF2784 domain-containing protein [Phycisphaerales bacterium]